MTGSRKNLRFCHGLELLAKKLPEPVEYFRGRTYQNPFFANNVIIFARLSFGSLQRKSFDAYSHHRHVFVVCLKGEGCVVIDGKDVRLVPGNALLIYPYQFHFFQAFAKKNINWLFVTFEPSEPKSLRNLENSVISLNESAYKIFEELVKGYRPSEAAGSYETCLLFTLLLNVCAEAPRESFSERRIMAPSRESTLIERIEIQLLKESESLVGVSALAQALGFSESHLRAIFRGQFQVSLGTYLRNFRANRAIAFMRNSKLTLTQIAMKLGFSSSAAFTRFFRSVTGVVPRDFRAKMRAPRF
jgi:AraC-like DNA-binding protein